MRKKCFFPGFFFAAAVLLSFPLLAGTVSEVNHISFLDGTASLQRAGTILLEDDFKGSEAQWAPVVNYENRLSVGYETSAGIPVLRISNQTGKKWDTAWSLQSKELPVKKEAKTFLLEFDIRGNLPMTQYKVGSASYANYLQWRRSDGTPFKTVHFPLPLPETKSTSVRIEGEIPTGTGMVLLAFGTDTPNFMPGDWLEFHRVRFSVFPTGARFWKEGSFVSAPSELSSGIFRWTGRCHPGTSIGFQLASAPDANGIPGRWSDFSGPDGKQNSWYMENDFLLPKFPPDAKWIRYRAKLTSKNGDVTPILSQVRIGKIEEMPWETVPDKSAPYIRLETASPSSIPFRKFSVSVKDNSRIQWESLQFILDKKDVTNRLSRNGNLLVFDNGIPFQRGLHIFRVRVCDIEGNQADAENGFYIGEIPCRNIPTVRDDGCLLVDGKPFFPIGMYGICKREINDNNLDKAFRDLKTAGFNFVQSYSETGKSYWDTADRHDFKIFIGGTSWKEIPQRSHPAVIAWYVGDDTYDNTTPEQFRYKNERVKNVDARRLTCQADVTGTSFFSRYRDYARYTDIFLPEVYPVHTDDPADIAKCVPKAVEDMRLIVRDIREVRTSPVSVWPIVQYFSGWNAWKRFPTREELRAMSWLVILNGANGIFWYTYGGFDKNQGVASTPERWENICSIASEIASLQTVLTERSEVPLVPMILQGPTKDVLGNPSISILVKKHGESLYVFAGNSTREKIKVALHIKKENARLAEVIFEKRSLPLNKYILTDEFVPLAIHIYKIDP